MYTMQDFSLISTYVKKYGEDYSIEEDSLAFYFFMLDIMLNIYDDEAKDSITDNFFLQKYGSISGHDRGIDAVYIDDSDNIPVVHLFNFKYAQSFEKSRNFLESNEIDKIEGFFSRMMLKEISLKAEINPVLFSKVEEIWGAFEKSNPKFVFYICSNYEKGFEISEKNRFERSLGRYSNIEIKYILAENIVDLVTKRNRKRIDAKIKAIDTNLFEKSDGNIRALIVNLDARDMIRALIDNDSIRSEVDFNEYDKIKGMSLAEDAFEDNVRVYLKKDTRINNNIYETALSDDNYKFFYFNNGITITCDHFEYPKGRRAPIIDLENLQIVNGGQTIHALFEAMSSNHEKVASVNLLCRIYETKDKPLSSRIAEYTNSQNPVNNRDIHSIDSLQIKLEREFYALGFYYERKKSQYNNYSKIYRIDAEKLGQSILAFYRGKPTEAKNSKRIIFSDAYDEIFNEQLNAKDSLLAYKLFNFIEDEKTNRRKDIVEQYDEFGYLSYSTYWILFFINQLLKIGNISITLDCFDKIKKLYPIVIRLLDTFVKSEKNKKGDSYAHSQFFKYNALKIYWDEIILNSKEEILEEVLQIFS